MDRGTDSIGGLVGANDTWAAVREPMCRIGVGAGVSALNSFSHVSLPLTHRVHIIEANGVSYRLEQSQKRLAKRKKRAGNN